MRKKYLIIALLFLCTVTQTFSQDSTKVSRRKHSKSATTLHRNLGDTSVVNPSINSSKPHSTINNNSLNPSGTTSGNNPSTQFIIPLNKNKKHPVQPVSDTSK